MSLFSFASTASAQTLPLPFPTGLAGSYRGLLTQPGDPLDSAFGRVEVNVTSKGSVSGKLILIDKKTYAFTSKLVTDEGGLTASKIGVVASKTKAGVPLITLDLSFGGEDVFTVSGTSTLTTRAVGTFATLSGYSFKVVTYNAKTNICAWKGVYTATFSDPTPASENIPTGSAYASGSVGTTGSWKLSGRLADGTSFTGSMPAGASPRYFMFTTPYSLVGGCFASTFDLSARSDGKYHVADGAAAWVRWTKMADATTVSFGPVDCIQTCNQWKVPGKTETIRGLMGLEAADIFDIDFSGALDTTTYAKYIPTKLGINSSGSLRAAAGLEGTPNPYLTSAWSKFFSGKIDPKTGVVKVTIKVTDNISLTTKPKYLTRSVTFTGVMFQLLPELLDTTSFVGGYTYTPPLPPLTLGTYGSFAFNGPILLDETFAGSVAMKSARSFTTLLDMLSPGTPAPTVTLPSTTSPVTVSLAQDLKSVTFNGRKVPLLSGQLLIPGQLVVFSDAKTSAKNNLTVQIMFDFAGQPVGLNANYYQVTISGYIPTIRLRNYTHRSGTINLLP